MEENPATHEELIRRYLARMVDLQEKFEEPRDELNDMRREARADGLNVEALNLLVPLISKYPHDKGAKVLNEVIHYAEIFGAEDLVSQGAAGARHAPEPVSGSEDSQPKAAEKRSPAASRQGTRASRPFRRSTAVMAAVFLSIGLIWLLN